MKPLLIVLLLLAGVLAFTLLRANPSVAPSAAPAVRNLAQWEQPIPEGTELLPGGAATVHVRHTRRNDRGRAILALELSEEHGYMVDGVNVEYWYCGKAGVAGVNGVVDNSTKPESQRIVQFVSERIGFDQKLTVPAVMREIEFENLNIDLGATTTEEWACQVIGYSRAMKKK